MLFERRISERKTRRVRKRAASGPVEMYANRLRTARCRLTPRPPAPARVRAVRQSVPVGRTPTASPNRLRGVRRIRGRLSGASGAAAVDGKAGLRLGQVQDPGGQQTDREVVHAGRAEEPLRTQERDDVRNDVRDAGTR